jgi:aspartate racemase
MKRIGLLGGISHHTTIEYYKRIMDLYSLRKGDLNFPEIVIYSLSHSEFKKYEDTNDIENYVNYISVGVERLIDSGADFIAMAANSPHKVLDKLRDRFNIPFISALDSAYEASIKQNIKKGLLLGIKFTMQSDFYQERFKQGGIDLITPNIDEQELVNDIIFKRLTNGQEIESESKEKILDVISHYTVDGVLLGCMRLPVFFNKQTVKGLNLVNTLEKHIEDILDYTEN